MFEDQLTNPETLKKLAKWINDNTDNLLDVKDDELKKMCNPNSIFWLVNTVCLESKWATPFVEKNNKEYTFNNYDGTKNKTTFMSRVDELASFYATSDYQISELAFKDDIYIRFLLPTTGKEQDVLNSRDAISDLLNYTSLPKESLKVYYTIPKFDIMKDHENMIETFAKLGVTSIFSPAADLSGINGNHNLYINEVKHKARVTLDNDGVKAAAYTALSGVTKSPNQPKYLNFLLDRPFVYEITDSTGLPLFMGSMTKF